MCNIAEQSSGSCQRDGGVGSIQIKRFGISFFLHWGWMLSAFGSEGVKVGLGSLHPLAPESKCPGSWKKSGFTTFNSTSWSNRAVLERPWSTWVAPKSKHQLSWASTQTSSGGSRFPSCLRVIRRRGGNNGDISSSRSMDLRSLEMMEKKSCILSASINQIAWNFVICLAPVETGPICWTRTRTWGIAASAARCQKPDGGFRTARGWL